MARPITKCINPLEMTDTNREQRHGLLHTLHEPVCRVWIFCLYVYQHTDIKYFMLKTV